jgi:hypothetical protein
VLAKSYYLFPLFPNPKPRSNSHNENPEPKAQPPCLFARLHKEIISPTARANQRQSGRHPDPGGVPVVVHHQRASLQSKAGLFVAISSKATEVLEKSVFFRAVLSI